MTGGGGRNATPGTKVGAAANGAGCCRGGDTGGLPPHAGSGDWEIIGSRARGEYSNQS